MKTTCNFHGVERLPKWKNDGLQETQSITKRFPGEAQWSGAGGEPILGRGRGCSVLPIRLIRTLRDSRIQQVSEPGISFLGVQRRKVLKINISCPKAIKTQVVPQLLGSAWTCQQRRARRGRCWWYRQGEVGQLGPPPPPVEGAGESKKGQSWFRVLPKLSPPRSSGVE